MEYCNNNMVLYVVGVTPPDFNEHVGANLKRIRQTAGWSQEDLATKLAEYGLPLPQQTIVRIEQGSRPLKLEEGLAVAEILGVSVKSLAQQFDNEKVAAAAAQIQRSNIIIARTEQGIVDIRERAERDEKEAYAFIERVIAGKRDAERQLKDAGATQDDEGRWHLNGTVIDV